MSARVGGVLSGCGGFDGSGITEAVSILIALDKHKTRIMCMAPNIAQSETINHTTKKPDSQSRRVMEEAARIARGNIRDIAGVRAEELDALVFPGGYGAVKNLSTFATDGPSCKVNEHVERLLREMAKAKKPIGLACIAPVLAARVLGHAGLKPKLTIGTDKESASAINAMKGQHQDCGETEICVDEANRLVTTPCYMNNVGPWVVYQGAEKMIEQVLRMAGSR